MPPDDTGRDRLSTAAFVVGLVSAVTAVVYFVALPVGVAGLVLGAVALRRGTERRLALAGTILSIVGVAVALGVVAFLVADEDHAGRTSIVDGIASGTADDEHPPQRDSHPDVRCQADIEVLRASGTVTNHTDTVADYQLVIVWESITQPGATSDVDGFRGKVLAESTAILDAVDPDTSRRWEVTAVGRGDSSTSCRVLRIDRVPA